jgi:hypothetical protein
MVGREGQEKEREREREREREKTGLIWSLQRTLAC